MQNSFTIRTPVSHEDFQQREVLLQTTLRSKTENWTYSDEYPIVLAKQNARYSYCVFDQDRLIAHLSAWPRTFLNAKNQERCGVILIGNVATLLEKRGLGIQRQLLHHIENLPETKSAEALVLWSDLLEFYQKLGFTSNCEELRININSKSTSYTKVEFRILNQDQLSDLELKQLLALRPSLEVELERSIQEFRLLIAIPATTLIVSQLNGSIVSWFVVGKGADMQGVIHEWGAIDPKTLVETVESVNQSFDLEGLVLLCPSNIDSKWHEYFEFKEFAISRHNMALIKPMNGSDLDHLPFNRTFIWGLDSI